MATKYQRHTWKASTTTDFLAQTNLHKLHGNFPKQLTQVSIKLKQFQALKNH